jgi:hypothetical protein
MQLSLTTESVVGFSGARRPSASTVMAVRWALAQLSDATRVVVGCADGVDALVRATIPPARLRVFAVAAGGFGRGAFAARSIACVRAVAAADGLWVSFPDGNCPLGLLPAASAAACFAGYGSGSWASLALALGLQMRALVFLPPGISIPMGWGFCPVPHCPGWWVITPTQPSLFA